MLNPYKINALAQNTSTTLKADRIDGDRKNNIINASGNVEVTRGQDKLISDKLSYNQNNKNIIAKGDVVIDGDKVGKVFAKEIEIKDDFTSGKLEDGGIVFQNGSYVTSPNIIRENKNKTILLDSIFSFCPSPKIKSNYKKIENDIALISVKSKKTIINKDSESAKIHYGTLRINEVPVFFTPYISLPLKGRERKTGFLSPSYLNTGNLGFGLKIPYYFNLEPNKDLTTTTQYHPAEKHLIISNDYRHLTKNGAYEVGLEVANNNLTDTDYDSNRRWLLKSNGKIDISKNALLEFDINNVGDKHYLREYHNDFTGNTVSEINLANIDDNNYNSIKAVKIQELETDIDSREEVNSIPILNSYIQSKPGKLNETYSILTNSTFIYRRSGLQYRRLTLNPEITLPYNISGNIFKLSASTQSDFYNMDDNFESTSSNVRYDKNEFDYRPQAALSWNLPLIRKTKNSSLIFEPKANFVTSSYSKNDDDIPNEDTNDTELTQGNLFLNDRFVGFDRNESGQRINYGFTSNLFNKYGQFSFGLGQGYRKNNKEQDVIIRGFNDQKSNIVGKLSYKSNEVLNIVYNFQLNESDYNNEVNELNTNFNTKRFNIYSRYILIRENINDIEEREQITIGANSKIYKNLNSSISATKDLVENKIISKKLDINYQGCCVLFGFSISQYNPSNLIKEETSYNLNLSIKN